MHLSCLFVVLVKQEKGVLQCPTCIGMGSDVELQCVKNTTIKSCLEPRPLCVQVTKPGLLWRLCWSEAEFFEFSKGHCESDKGCQAVKLSVSSPPPQKVFGTLSIFVVVIFIVTNL